jgi:tRNA pseudouridine13 synthase
VGVALNSGPPWAPGYPHRTAEEAPIPFSFKQSPEDFVVEERAASPPDGAGDHLWLWVEKRGVATIDAALALTRALGREPRDAGFAGRKDVRAVTRQWISIEHADPDRARGLELPGVRVLAVERSNRKLRVGQLAGNRFELILRGVAPEDQARVRRVLDVLVSRGLPNLFGSQRFGRSGTTQDLGALLLAGDDEAYLAAFLSPEHAGPSAAVAELARLIVSGTWSERRGAGALVGDLDPDRGAVALQLVRRPKHLGWAVRAVPKRTRRFHLSALQAVVFNRVLAARFDEPGGIDGVLAGDLVRDHDLRTVAPAEGALELAPLHLSATGGLPGSGRRAPTGPAAELEAAALAAQGIAPGAFEALPKALGTPGARRALRVPVKELELRFDQDRAHLGFVLPAGSYATTLLEELRKQHGPGTSFQGPGSA